MEEIEEIEEEKVEENSPADPALKSAMWRVVVRAALAKREGRDLRAEVEAEKRAQEEKSPQDRDTAILKQVDAPSESLSSLPASVHLKDGGSAMEKGSGSSASTAYFAPPPAAPSPEDAPHTGSQSQTKVIDRIDGNTNE